MTREGNRNGGECVGVLCRLLRTYDTYSCKQTNSELIIPTYAISSIIMMITLEGMDGGSIFCFCCLSHPQTHQDLWEDCRFGAWKNAGWDGTHRNGI